MKGAQLARTQRKIIRNNRREQIEQINLNGHLKDKQKTGVKKL